MSDKYYVVVEGSGKPGTVKGYREVIGFYNEEEYERNLDWLTETGREVLEMGVSFERAHKIVSQMPYESLVTKIIIEGVQKDGSINSGEVVRRLNDAVVHAATIRDEQFGYRAINFRLINCILPPLLSLELTDAICKRSEETE